MLNIGKAAEKMKTCRAASRQKSQTSLCSLDAEAVCTVCAFAPAMPDNVFTQSCYRQEAQSVARTKLDVGSLWMHLSTFKMRFQLNLDGKIFALVKPSLPMRQGAQRQDT